MDWPLTLAIIAAGAALLGVSVWQDSRPKKDSLKPRFRSWKFLILLAGAVIAFALVHAVNLLGFHTGGNSRPY